MGVVLLEVQHGALYSSGYGRSIEAGTGTKKGQKPLLAEKTLCFPVWFVTPTALILQYRPTPTCQKSQPEVNKKGFWGTLTYCKHR